MFLDDSTVWPRRDDPPPPPPPRRQLTPRQTKTVARLLLIYAFVLLLAPIGVTGLGDVVRYIAAHL